MEKSMGIKSMSEVSNSFLNPASAMGAWSAIKWGHLMPQLLCGFGLINY